MSYLETYQEWLHSPALSPAEKAELESIANDPKEIESRFFDQLSFGTAGLRGTMCTGLHQMNVHVIRHTTQAFAEVVKAEGVDACAKGVAICFDCRNHSAEFAKEAACVMAGNGIQVRLFEAMRPTPELSFAIRKYGCQAGINVTASHNPKEYNGYKVYWEDGAQLPPKHADAIAAKMKELDVFGCVQRMDYDQAVAEGRIVLMGKETDEAFLSEVLNMVNDRACVAQVADRFSLVYTPFHGTGYQLIPEALKRLGMKHVLCVPEQMVIDGNFPTVVSPNPENPEGFALAVELAKKNRCDLIVGSDPDADRVGVMVRNAAGEYEVLSGNQTGVLLLDYLIGAKKRAGTLGEDAYALTTIVSTQMVDKICAVNHIHTARTFTGFKFLAEKKDALEAAGEGKVFFAFEESFGYMLGDYVRDKDAVTAIVLIAEMAAWYASQDKTLYDALQDCYAKYGHYGESTINLVMPGLDGMRDMAAIMEQLHKAPLTEVAGTAVVAQKDYQAGTVTDPATGAVTPMELKDSNVVAYDLADGTTFIIRPSGTEPKIKVYVLAHGGSQAECDEKLAKYTAFADVIKTMA